MDNQLDMHGELLLGQYRELLPRLKELEEQVSTMLTDAVKRMGIELNTLEHRSRVFVNGILDRIIQEKVASGEVVKQGRGLLEQ